MKEINLDNIDINGMHGNIRACNIDNKDEYVDFKMEIEKLRIIYSTSISEENIYFNGYDFFKDLHGVVRYSKVEPIESRFEILDI